MFNQLCYKLRFAYNNKIHKIQNIIDIYLLDIMYDWHKM